MSLSVSVYFKSNTWIALQYCLCGCLDCEASTPELLNLPSSAHVDVLLGFHHSQYLNEFEWLTHIVWPTDHDYGRQCYWLRLHLIRLNRSLFFLAEFVVFIIIMIILCVCVFFLPSVAVKMSEVRKHWPLNDICERIILT